VECFTPTWVRRDTPQRLPLLGRVTARGENPGPWVATSVNYLTSTEAPASASLFLAASAASLARRASFRPAVLASRAALSASVI